MPEMYRCFVSRPRFFAPRLPLSDMSPGFVQRRPDKARIIRSPSVRQVHLSEPKHASCNSCAGGARVFFPQSCSNQHSVDKSDSRPISRLAIEVLGIVADSRVKSEFFKRTDHDPCRFGLAKSADAPVLTAKTPARRTAPQRRSLATLRLPRAYQKEKLRPRRRKCQTAS